MTHVTPGCDHDPIRRFREQQTLMASSLGGGHDRPKSRVLVESPRLMVLADGSGNTAGLVVCEAVDRLAPGHEVVRCWSVYGLTDHSSDCVRLSRLDSRARRTHAAACGFDLGGFDNRLRTLAWALGF